MLDHPNDAPRHTWSRGQTLSPPIHERYVRMIPAIRDEVGSMTKPTTVATVAVAAATIEEEEEELPPTIEKARLFWKRKASHCPPRSLSPRRRRRRSKELLQDGGDDVLVVVPVDAEPPSQSTRRSRRSAGSGGGEGGGGTGGGDAATYMALQIRYRGGNDWDPLNACWVPKQPKKPKKTHQLQQQQHHDNNNNNDDDNGTAVTTDSSSSLTTDQDSVKLSVQSSPTILAAESTAPQDMLQGEDSFQATVPEEAVTAMPAVVELHQDNEDERMMMMMMMKSSKRRRKDCTELSLDMKQPSENDDDNDDSNDNDIAISKNPLQETGPLDGLDPPAECTPSEETPATSSSSSKSLAEEPSPPQVEPKHYSLLDALFQAVEMAQEIPVDDTEEEEAAAARNRAPSLSAMDEDIFADSPNDETVNIPVPWCGEDAASCKLPRSELNVLVYGPTPPHMTEVWHQMYGSRWQDHHH